MFPGLVPLHANPENQPDPLTLERLFTTFTWDWFIIAVAALAIGLYAWGVWVLRRRGDHWPIGRTVSWMVGGVGSGLLATLTALGAYDTVLVSIHMVQHMVLSMFAPIFLALGAPMTLMLRTFPPKAHKVLLTILHTGIGKVVFFPPLVYALFVLNPWALYFTPLYDLTLRSEFWHNWLHGHFVITGCMFFWTLLGTDPIPYRLPYIMRVIMLMATLPFHSFLGVIIMGSNELIGEEWYLSFERTWGPSLADDQYVAGGILWGTGDFVILVIMAVLFVQWFRESQREAKREDRRLDRLEAAERRRAPGAERSAGTAARRDYDDDESTTTEATEDDHERRTVG
ncbi:cytochrome c oxidase assembly protein [Mariniluteicoccus flavus]